MSTKDAIDNAIAQAAAQDAAAEQDPKSHILDTPMAQTGGAIQSMDPARKGAMLKVLFAFPADLARADDAEIFNLLYQCLRNLHYEQEHPGQPAVSKLSIARGPLPPI